MNLGRTQLCLLRLCSLQASLIELGHDQLAASAASVRRQKREVGQAGAELLGGP